MAAFGNQEIALASLEDPLVIFDPPTLGFLDNVLAATDIIGASLDRVSLPFLVSANPLLSLQTASVACVAPPQSTQQTCVAVLPGVAWPGGQQDGLDQFQALA